MASVRECTRSAFRIALTCTLTVPSERLRSRQISLFGLPWTSSFSTSVCRAVSPSASGRSRTPSPSGIGAASGARPTPPSSTRRTASSSTPASAVLGMNPCAPAPSAAITVAWSCVAESTTTGTPRIVELQVAEEIQPARTGQREVEQHQRHLRLVVEHGGGFRGIGRTQHFDGRVDLRQQLRERIDDQRVIVDHENLHGVLPGDRSAPTAPLRGDLRG